MSKFLNLSLRPRGKHFQRSESESALCSETVSLYDNGEQKPSYGAVQAIHPKEEIQTPEGEGSCFPSLTSMGCGNLGESPVSSSQINEKSHELMNKTAERVNKLTIRAMNAIDVYKLGTALSDDIYICENAQDIIAELNKRIAQLESKSETETVPEKKKEIDQNIKHLQKVLRDVKRTKKAPCRTIKATASVAGGWGAGIAGGSAGAWLGAQTGAAIGTLFGPIGTVIGIPMGAICGALGAGISAGIAGSKSAHFAAEKGLSYLDEK